MLSADPCSPRREPVGTELTFADPVIAEDQRYPQGVVRVPMRSLEHRPLSPRRGDCPIPWQTGSPWFGRVSAKLLTFWFMAIGYWLLVSIAFAMRSHCVRIAFVPSDVGRT